MKTIVRKDSNISLYLLENSEYVLIEADKTIVGNPVQFYVDDCTTSDALLFDNVTDPGDWQAWKYFYIEIDGWVLNPDWIPPLPPMDDSVISE